MFGDNNDTDGTAINSKESTIIMYVRMGEDGSYLLITLPGS